MLQTMFIYNFALPSLRWLAPNSVPDGQLGFGSVIISTPFAQDIYL